MFTLRTARPAASTAALGLLVTAFMVAATPTPAAAATVMYVDAGASGGGTGTSWADAYPSLADALGAASSGSEIWVAAGRYTPTDGTDVSATFQLKDGVAVYGGFAGDETQRDQRDWHTNVTTLSGDLSGDDGAGFANRADNSAHVVTGATGATLDGVTVSGGSALSGTDWIGGGIYNSGSSPKLAHLVITDNMAVQGAGLGDENGSSPTLNDVVFDGNLAQGNGGGAASEVGTSLTLTDVTFTGNTAQGGRGGGLYSAVGAVTVTLTDVTFRGNSATYGGGLIFFTGNTATLANVLVTGNSAYYGGGLLTTGSSDLTLTNATISGNAALLAGAGGGMWNENGSTPQVRNSILWGNGSSNVVNSDDVGKPISVPVFSSSLVQGSGGSSAWNPSFGTDGGGNLDADPLFVTPVPAPAPTSGGDVHLSPGSPAVGAGSNGLVPAGLTTDLDGNPRIVGAAVDLGAFELQDVTPSDTTPPDTTIDGAPANPSTTGDASFTFSGTDDVTSAAALTYECALDGATFASCTSPATYSGLAPGSHTFEVRAVDEAGNVDPTPAAYTWTIQSQASTTLLYNGGQIVNVGSGFTPGALLSSSIGACSAGQSVSFSLDANPLTSAAGAYALGTGTTSSSGQATLAPISTTGWQEGTYVVTATFAGTPTCLPSSDTATLTVASPGAAASGGGWYTVSGSGRNNFGFTVRKVDTACSSNCAYKGQLLLINNGKWRVKGDLTAYSKTSGGEGAASGTGDLYWWNASLNDGAGDWVLAASGVAYTINVTDAGKPGKSSSDTFGIRIVYTPVAPQPSTLPNSTPQPLKGGDIGLS